MKLIRYLIQADLTALEDTRTQAAADLVLDSDTGTSESVTS